MAYPIINGNEFSFASAVVDFGGTKFYGVRRLNWKQELTPEDQYGNGAVPIGRTLGQFKASGDFEQLLSEYELLTAKFGNNYGKVPFNIGCQYVEQPGAGIVKVELIAVRIIGEEVSNEQGAGGTVMKVTLSIVRPIKINGRTLIDDLTQGAGLRVSPALVATG